RQQLKLRNSKQHIKDHRKKNTSSHHTTKKIVAGGIPCNHVKNVNSSSIYPGGFSMNDGVKLRPSGRGECRANAAM
ncbi:hypothetical protein, partial [Escherichia coli]|uniref:hypothetical protein n=4 Tax=Escherichia coli TaxID=562 RepID=UPI001A7E7BEC